MFVIGCAGQMQAGKDTLADRLAYKLNEINESKWSRKAFASNVKKVFCETFNVDLAFIEEWKVKSEAPPGFDMPVRQSLQFIGDGFRKIKGSIWLDLTFRDINPMIISDVRYIDEFVRVKTEGGLNVLIGRPDRLNDDSNGSEAQIRPYIDWCLRAYSPTRKFVDLRDVEYTTLNGMLSDSDKPPINMNQFDVFIRNDGTIEEFKEVIDTKLIPFVNNFVFEFK
jgi:hypothetical protein